MTALKERLFDFGLLWLRVLMGMGIAYHGYGKIFGGRMAMFAEGVSKMGLPAPEFFAWAAAFSEFLGGIFVALGLGTRPAAFFIFATMSVAAFIRHSQDPFKVKELALAYWTAASALMFTGAGTLSLDSVISKWRKK